MYSISIQTWASRIRQSICFTLTQTYVTNVYYDVNVHKEKLPLNK